MTLRPSVVLAGLALLALGTWLALAHRDRLAGAMRGEVANAPEGSREHAGARPAAALEGERRAALPASAAPEALSAPPAFGAGADASDAPAPPRDLRRVHVFGRVEDEQGAPIAGAALVAPLCDHDAVLARTDAAGNLDALVELDLESAALRDWVAWDQVYSAVLADGFVGREVVLRARPEEELHLGTLRLAAGTPVSGRAVGPAGDGVAGAIVKWVPAALLPESAEDVAEFGVGDARQEPGFLGLALVARAGMDGEFRFPGLPRVSGFLAADASGHGVGVTELLPFEVGAPLAVRVELPRAAPPPRISGVVLRPDGTPHAGAEIDFHDAETAWIGGVAHADEQGRFDAYCGDIDSPTVALRAVDPERRFSASETWKAHPGDADVVLRLAPARTLVVRLVDAQGAPVPWGHVRSQNADQDWPLTPAGREGVATLLLPRVAFEVEALAPGYRTQTFGPFTGANLSAGLELVMTPGEAVRGRVLAGGKPVAGARVALTRTPYAAGRVGRAEGVAPPDRPFDVLGSVDLDRLDATTAQDGTFVATLHDDGLFTLAAEADGYARTVLGPYAWNRAEGAQGLEVVLQRPGSIEGRFLGAEGESVQGQLIAASDGWGEAWIAVADAQGRFGFEELAPGPWQVRPALPPVGKREKLQPGTGADARAIRWDATVRAGETSRIDLEPGAAPVRTLRGRIESAGSGLAGATVALEPGDSMGRFGAHALAEQETDEEGRFELSVREGERFVVRVDIDDLSVFQLLDLPPGTTTWDLALETGRLELTGSLPEALGDGPTWVGVRAELAGGAQAFCGDFHAERMFREMGLEHDRGFRLARAPAGNVDLIYAPFIEVRRRGFLDETLWTPAGVVQVEPGSETSFVFP